MTSVAKIFGTEQKYDKILTNSDIFWLKKQKSDNFITSQSSKIVNFYHIIAGA